MRNNGLLTDSMEMLTILYDLYEYIPVLYDSIQVHSYIDTDKLDHIC